MLTGMSALVALCCVLASLRRLYHTIAPTALDPALLVCGLKIDAGLAHGLGEARSLSGLASPGHESSARDSLSRLCTATANEARFGWEHEVLSAFLGSPGPLRDAKVNEQLTELDALLDGWARVPRVCASVATSAGFFFASIWLLDAVTPAVGTEGLMSTLTPALDALALGIAGMAFCVSIQVRARAARKRRMKDTDGLLVVLQALIDGPRDEPAGRDRQGVAGVEGVEGVQSAGSRTA